MLYNVLIMLKSIPLFLFFSAGLSLAGEFDSIPIAKIEKALAVSSGCSLEQPCNIEITENDQGFVAKVVKAAKITEDGVLKYLPSATYYQLNKEGEIVTTNPTP